MKRFSIVLIFLAACQSSSDSKKKLTGSDWQVLMAGQEGHGGDAIVCFDIPLDRALSKVVLTEEEPCAPGEDCVKHREEHSVGNGPSAEPPEAIWRMTEAGRRAIQSAKPLEQYLGERIAGRRAFFKRLNESSIENGYQLALQPFTQLPAAFEQIEKMHRNLGWLEQDGIASEYGLIDINDSGFVNESEIDAEHCKELQAVVRRDQQLWYDPDIIAHFDNAGKIIIQLHEEIYAWGKEQDEKLDHYHGREVHFDSTKTRRLILKVLDDNIETDVLNESLKSLGFSAFHWASGYRSPTPAGYFMTSNACAGERAQWTQMLNSPIEDLSLAATNFVTERYLKVEDYNIELGLTANYPEALANLIQFALNARMSNQGFKQGLEPLVEQLMKPEACIGQF